MCSKTEMLFDVQCSGVFGAGGRCVMSLGV